jgi:BRO family, N-terminal domain
MSSLKLFEHKNIRSHWDAEEEKWYFSIVDVVDVLTDSTNPRDYWFKMKLRVKTEDGLELSTICRQLKLKANNGKMRETDVADTETLLRIIQSIPSPKAEPFKQWLAKVGYERMQEISNFLSIELSEKIGQLKLQTYLFRFKNKINTELMRLEDTEIISKIRKHLFVIQT